MRIDFLMGLMSSNRTVFFCNLRFFMQLTAIGWWLISSSIGLHVHGAVTHGKWIADNIHLLCLRAKMLIERNRNTELVFSFRNLSRATRYINCSLRDCSFKNAEQK